MQVAAFLQLDAPIAGTERVRNGNGAYSGGVRDLPPEAGRLGYDAGLSPRRPLAGDLRCRHPLKSVRHAGQSIACDA